MNEQEMQAKLATLVGDDLSDEEIAGRLGNFATDNAATNRSMYRLAQGLEYLARNGAKIGIDASTKTIHIER